MSNFPATLEKLIDKFASLPGVGRKTANLILGDVYGVPSVVVDTHVKRITNKLGLTKNKEPEKIEMDLREILPEEYYTHFNHVTVFHGRAICKAKGAMCMLCPVNHLCDSYTK